MAVITTLGVPDNTGNTTTIMPKLQYRFRATFIGEGFTATPTRSVISVSRPSLTHDEIPLDMFKKIIIKFFIKFLYRYADLCISNSSYISN